VSPRYIGVNPNEVVWKSLKISWWQRVVRRMAVIGFIAALVIFWAIPVAAVGLISNVHYLEQFSWLHWLAKIPTIFMGVIERLLPAVLLSILMSLVPVIMRCKPATFLCIIIADSYQYALSSPENRLWHALSCLLRMHTSCSKWCRYFWSSQSLRQLHRSSRLSSKALLELRHCLPIASRQFRISTSHISLYKASLSLPE
jgi:hypothetical protein